MDIGEAMYPQLSKQMSEIDIDLENRLFLYYHSRDPYLIEAFSFWPKIRRSVEFSRESVLYILESNLYRLLDRKFDEN